MAYIKAEEVHDIARQLIQNKHTRLQGAKIVYMFHPDTWTQGGGKTVIYRVTKIANKIKEALELEGYTEIDFLIEFAEKAFFRLDSRLQEAAVDEALCNIGRSENGEWTKLNYDFRGFLSNLRDYGAWSAELQLVEEKIRQTSLFETERLADEIIEFLETPDKKAG